MLDGSRFVRLPIFKYKQGRLYSCDARAGGKSAKPYNIDPMHTLTGKKSGQQEVPASTPDSPVAATELSGDTPDSPVCSTGQSGGCQSDGCNFVSNSFVIEEFRDLDKLGQGFTSADPLEEVDIGDGTIPRPTFVNKTLKSDSRDKLIGLLKDYFDCFAWSYTEMSGLNRDIVEHRLPIKPGFQPFKQKARHFGPDIYPRIKDEIHGFWKLILLDLAGTLIGCPMWYRWKRKIPTSFGCALIFVI